MSFSHDVAGGNGQLIAQSIHSPNYEEGVSGWTINKDGTAEFQDADIRGSVTIDSGGDGVFIYGAGDVLDQAGADVLDESGADILDGSDGELLVSIAASAGTDSYGNDYPQGIEVNSGVIEGSTITGGTITGTDINGGTITGTVVEGGTIKGTTITGTTVNAGVINANTINDNTLQYNQLSYNTITANTIDSNTLSANTITGGTISGTDITGVNIDATSTLTGSTITGGTITGGTIEGTTITGSTLTATGTDGSDVVIGPGSSAVIKMTGPGATHATVPPMIYGAVTDAGESNEAEWLIMQSGQSAASSANDNAALELIGAAADGSAPARAQFQINGNIMPVNGNYASSIPVVMTSLSYNTCDTTSMTKLSNVWDIPANDANAGTTYRLKGYGYGYQNGNAFNFQVYAWNTIISTAGLGAVGFPSGGVEFNFSFEAILTVVSNGSSATVLSNIQVIASVATGTDAGGAPGTSSFTTGLVQNPSATLKTVDTTAAGNITLQCAVDTTANSPFIECTMDTFERLGP